MLLVCGAAAAGTRVWDGTAVPGAGDYGGSGEAFFGMPSDDLPASGGERAQPCEQEEGKMRSICGMASDDMAGDAKRRVPLP